MRYHPALLVFAIVLIGCRDRRVAAPAPQLEPRDGGAPLAATDAGAAVDAPVTGLPLAKPASKIDRATAKKIARSVLLTPEAVELIRIPWGKRDEPTRDPRGILGYAIEAQRVARYPAAVGRAVDSFIGYTGDDSSKLPMCFYPHHAIIARSATNRVAALICYQCARFEVHVDGYDGSFDWSMRDWEEPTSVHAFFQILEALYDESGMPPAVSPRMALGPM